VTIASSVVDRRSLLVPVPGPGRRDVGAPEQGTVPQSPHVRVQHLQRAGTSAASVLPQVRSALVMVTVLALGLVLELTVISGWVHRSDQTALFNRFRTELALGTGPVGAVRPSLAIGSPMALIAIPSIGVKQVVVEGTTGSALMAGPGHVRSTVFPGGSGNSIILGRAASFGGPFGQISRLVRGDRITVTTQVGRSVFRVIGVRYGKGHIVRVAPGKSRLTLETSAGASYVPSGVVAVYADKIGTPVAASAPPVGAVTGAELPLGIDTSTLWELFFWLEMLVVLVAGAVWTWRRLGRARAWIVFTAPLVLVWIFTTDQVVRLLPNLL
jgi:sortase A